MSRKLWKPEEKQLLRDKYETEGLGCGEIAVILNRTHFSVQVCAKRLRLRHSKKQELALRSRINTGLLNPMYGRVGPNLGLTKENCARIKEASVKVSQTRIRMFLEGRLPDVSGCKNPMYGMPSWCKGKTKNTDVRLANSGPKISKIKKALWAALSEDEKEKRRIFWGSQWRKNRVGKKQNTSIEIAVAGWLEKLNIKFIQQVQFGRWTVDFFIPEKNTVIECDGDYWHCNPLVFDRSKADNTQKKNMERDAKKDLFLCASGVVVIHIWEKQIVSREGLKLIDQLLPERTGVQQCA